MDAVMKSPTRPIVKNGFKFSISLCLIPSDKNLTVNLVNNIRINKLNRLIRIRTIFLGSLSLVGKTNPVHRT